MNCNIFTIYFQLHFSYVCSDIYKKCFPCFTFNLNRTKKFKTLLEKSGHRCYTKNSNASINGLPHSRMRLIIRPLLFTAVVSIITFLCRLFLSLCIYEIPANPWTTEIWRLVEIFALKEWMPFSTMSFQNYVFKSHLNGKTKLLKITVFIWKSNFKQFS